MFSLRRHENTQQSVRRFAVAQKVGRRKFGTSLYYSMSCADRWVLASTDDASGGCATRNAWYCSTCLLVVLCSAEGGSHLKATGGPVKPLFHTAIVSLAFAWVITSTPLSLPRKTHAYYVQVPHIRGKTVQRQAEGDGEGRDCVTNTYQLIGKFLFLRPDEVST